MVNSFVKREDLATEMTVVRNEFETGENSPSGILVAADDGRRLRVAQLRQVDHRQPHRHRARADRQPAGLLHEVLPARQRHADRRRQVRRGEGAWSYVDKYFGTLPKPDRKLDADLHRGAGPGRRARGDAAPRRRRRRRRRRLPHPRRRPRRLPRRRGAAPTSSASQPSGRLYKALVETKKAAQRRRLRLRAARPRACSRSAPRSRQDRASLEEVRDVDDRDRSRGWPHEASPRRRSTAPSRSCSRTASCR